MGQWKIKSNPGSLANLVRSLNARCLVQVIWCFDSKVDNAFDKDFDDPSTLCIGI